MTTTTDTRARTTPSATPANLATPGASGLRHVGAARRPRALVSAQFVVMLDTSIVNVALPSIQADLGLGAADATWIVNAYVLAFGGLLLLSGRARRPVGRRRMFIGGLGPVHPGTLVAAAAQTRGCSWLAASSKASAPPHSVLPRCPCSS